ncbi:PREDICTED: protein JASON-like isoform X2 [Tarenaya hassleriana]|uniref:protein JASON-like isoform X2 n=1 Tax=Tarenaya hassleriana TaxID=28532 RepID=UPI00053C3CB0|nr:PREDICTED: protein JASON-like isoform X2 [Tarenaya hassleriana]
MRHLLLKRRINLFCRSALRFLDVSVCRAMGCFFNCFRPRDDLSTNNLASHSTRVKSRRGQSSQNPLSALFQSEASPGPKKEGSGLDSIHIDKGLKDEARFLKACGTLPKTPMEIRNASRKQDTPQHERDSVSSQFHSWISGSLAVKSLMDENTYEPPTPLKACEEMGQHSVASEQTPGSCVTDAQNSGRIASIFSEVNEEGLGNIGTEFEGEVDKTCRATPAAGNVSGRIKSVRFECDFDQPNSSGSSYNSSSRKPEMMARPNFAVTSPNPTPLKLSDEMQTPGTVFPAYLELAGRGKPKIRSQFVYPLSKRIENATLSKFPAESESGESLERDKTQACKEIHGRKGEESSCERVLKVEASSFSPWLKQGNEENGDNAAALSPRAAMTPGDRPIIGMVAAHWNVEELSTQVSPKWWDGNGIPNSTNKYKEDQKVSWHATPFEERLEKALSKESFVSQTQRKTYDGGMGVMEEEAEGETAISQLQHSAAQSKSVVSF